MNDWNKWFIKVNRTDDLLHTNQSNDSMHMDRINDSCWMNHVNNSYIRKELSLQFKMNGLNIIH